MSWDIKIWNVKPGDNGLPSSMDELKKIAFHHEISSDVLLRASKWDFMMKNGRQENNDGYVRLSDLATTRRGITTGANDFFHLRPSYARSKKLPDNVLSPCIGRSSDVIGFEFSQKDWEHLYDLDKKVFLFIPELNLSPDVLEYLKQGENDGLAQRYNLSRRRPWFSMEEQDPAPIWAAVFGRAGLRFIRNTAEAKTLTTFHCIYPYDKSSAMSDAITLCLNAPSIQARAKAHHRVYGGGLLKYEPKDLLDIELPDLRQAAKSVIDDLSFEYQKIVSQFKKDKSNLNWETVEKIIGQLSFKK